MNTSRQEMGTLIIRLYLIVLTYYQSSDGAHEVRGICRCSCSSEVYYNQLFPILLVAPEY